MSDCRPDGERQLAAMREALDNATSASDVEAKIGAWSEVLKIESTLDPSLASPHARDVTKGFALESIAGAYMGRKIGNPQENLEAAITYYEAALEVRVREELPADWARIQMCRAEAYHKRTRESRSTNLEVAIKGYSAALEIYTREATPIEWALAHSARANAYSKRIRYFRANNLEKAIAGYNAALKVYSRDATPVEWARTQMNRAIAYKNRIHGDRARNLETAIAGFDAALEIRTRETMPVDWALVQLNRAIAYRNRILGIHADNLTTAIAGYDAALTVLNRRSCPNDWAIAQMNRALANLERVRGNPADNIEDAITGLDAALDVFSPKENPIQWAAARRGRADALSERIRGVRADNLEAAILDYDKALEFYTKEENPFDWAITQMNRAVSYQRRVSGIRSENLEVAVAAYDKVLEVHTRQRAPNHWAEAQINRANAFRDRVYGVRADNLKVAIQGYKSAMEVFTSEAVPNEHLRAARLLGSVRLMVGDWAGAADALGAARSTADLLVGQGLNEAETKRVLEEASAIGPEAAFAAVKLGNNLGAFRQLEAGRARHLAIALRHNTIRDALNHEDRSQFDVLRSEVFVAERALEMAKEGERQAKLDQLIALRRKLSALVDKGQAAQVAIDPNLEEQLDVLTDGGIVVVAPIFTRAGGILLIAHQGAGDLKIEAVDLATGSLDTLNDELRGEDNWLAAYGSDDTRISAIGRIGDRLWDLIGDPLVKALGDRDVAPGARLLLLPQGALGLLPLGLARDPDTGECLIERFELTLAPSIAVLDVEAHNSGATPSLAAIVNPTGDLRFTPIEAAFVERMFASNASSTVQGDKATVEAVVETLKAKSHWLFSCHGIFDWSDPRQSGLMLAHGEMLTLDTILSAQGLSSPRLVALSACETGLHDIHRSPEEFIGLPAGFLQIGATGVLATLWPVNDLSTALLTSRFFYHQVVDDMRPAAALKAAQLWVRDLTVRNLRELLREACQFELTDAVTALLTDLRHDLATRSPTKRPFQSPYYWGGFTLHGS